MLLFGFQVYHLSFARRLYAISKFIFINSFFDIF